MLQAILGIFVFIFIGLVFSNNRKKVQWKIIIIALLMQFVLGFLLSKLPFLQAPIFFFSKLVQIINNAASDGSIFVFGYLGGATPPFQVESGGSTFIIAFQILPVIIVMSALSALLYHLGVMQFIVKILSKFLSQFLKLDPVEAIGVASSIFLGIIEAPLFVKPYLSRLSSSSLFLIITAAMATVAGSVLALYSSIISPILPNSAGEILIASVMSAPAAVLFALLLYPKEQPNVHFETIELKVQTESIFEAIINGTMEGLQMVLSICAVLIVLFAFVSMINTGLAYISLEGFQSIEAIGAYPFKILCYFMGIESKDNAIAAELMATKTFLNEFVSYSKLSSSSSLSEKSRLILTYAMCGFANFGSLGILVGGLGTLLPERKKEISKLGLKAILAGTLATMLTGTIIGLIR